MKNSLEVKIDNLLVNVGDIALRRRSKSILLNIDLKPQDKILEIGCGDGFYLYVLSKLDKRVSLTGIDIDLKAIESARKNLKGRKVKLVVADAVKLPFKNSTFNKIIMSEVIEHLKDDLAGLKEAYRVLKKGGILFVTVPNANYPFLWDPINWVLERLFNKKLQKGIWGIWAQHLRLYSPRELQKRLKRVGFKVQHIESQVRWSLPFNHYLITLGAVMLAKKQISSKTKAEVSKFSRPKGIKSGLIKLFFDISNYVDKFNNKISLEGPAEGIFVVSKK